MPAVNTSGRKIEKALKKNGMARAE